MLATLWSLVLKLIGAFLARGPSPEARAEGRASAAETQLSIEETADAEVKNAQDAARAVARADARDAVRLRDGSDPDCRDCSAPAKA